jgi:hypothetical protein
MLRELSPDPALKQGKGGERSRTAQGGGIPEAHEHQHLPTPMHPTKISLSFTEIIHILSS